QHESELKTRDEKETNLYLQIDLLKNRVKHLESLLGVRTRNYRAEPYQTSHATTDTQRTIDDSINSDR
ncbi:76_t:CDS:1, partial [Scutellospora calospora]